MRLAIFISGSGSNMVAIAEAAQRGDLKAEIISVICDNPNAPGIEKAKNLGLDVWPVSWQKEQIEILLKRLKDHNVEMIALAGFMRMIPPYFLKSFAKPIVNIHPSLLPKYAGLHGIKDSYESGDEQVGITIHYVDEGMDTGPIIAQFECSRGADETLEQIEHKIHALEHANYWKILQKIIEETA